MNYYEFLNEVIERGIAGAKESYANDENKDRLNGSIAGFEECRGRTPLELYVLYTETVSKMADAMSDQIEFDELKEELSLDEIGIKQEKDYWYHRCMNLEIEWVCNCVSAMMINENCPPLFPHLPTARATLLVAEIVGVKTE